MENKFNLILLIALILLLLPLIGAPKGSSTNYDVFSKFDFGASGNSTSASFVNRFISGNQPVSNYTSSSFTGRLGVLSTTKNLAINITFPLDFSEIARGNDATANEDDLAAVPNAINIRAKVFTNGTTTGFSGANCYFYDNSVLLGNSSTNSSGDCILSWTKSGLSVGSRNLTVNYSSTTSDTKVVSFSSVNVSIARYVTSLSMNAAHSSKFYDGETATLTMTISKINLTGTSAYDPQNITSNATTSAGIVYPGGTSYYPANITRTGVGVYTTNVTVNYTFSTLLKWNVWLTDDNFVNHIGSAVHADVAVCSGDFGAWSTCSSSTQSRTDSSGCTESQSCDSGGGGGGGGGGDSCSNECTTGETEIVCVTENTLRTRTCGNYDADSCTELGGEVFTDCGEGSTCQNAQCVLLLCDDYWQCGSWGQCFLGNPLEFSPEGITQSSITGSTILENTGFALVSTIIKPNIVSINKKAVEQKKESLITKIKNFLSFTGKGIFDFFQKGSNCEVLGEKQCHPTKSSYYQECTSKQTAKGIIYTWKNFKVPKGMICENGEAVCTIKNSCETESEKKCISSSKTQTCEKDVNGCLKWGTKTRCKTGELCEEGICQVKHCSDSIQNFDEEGIDCGGSCLTECIPVQICGNSVIEEGENCDNDVKLCTINNYNGNQKCKIDCLGYDICISTESCGDGILNGIEECDDGNLIEKDGCYNCNIELTPPNQTTNKTILPPTLKINLILETIPEIRKLIEVGGSIDVEINQGDKISVTYENKNETDIIIRIKIIEQGISQTKETHSITIDEVQNGIIKVTAKSEPVTKEIYFGGTETFEFGVAETPPGGGGGGGGGGGSGNKTGGEIQGSPIERLIQIAVCQNTLCELDDKTIIRECENLCEEKWECEWTLCVENDTLTYPYDCVDLTGCGTETYKPTEPISCDDRPLDECNESVWSCSVWGECDAKYSMKDILLGKVSIKGSMGRACKDSTEKCDDKSEKRPCDLTIPINAEKIKWCEEEYVEIKEKETNKLISRVKETEIPQTKEILKLDISFIISNFVGFCDYCYDGVKDYDETDVDCGGPNCISCDPGYDYFDWLFWLIISSWSVLVILLLYYYKKRREEVEGIGIKERLKNLFKGKSEKEARIKERKIADWFNRIIKLPFRIKITRARRPKEEVVEKEVIRLSPEEDLLAKLKRKLRMLRKEGYYGTARIESEIQTLEQKIKSKEKSFVKRIAGAYRRSREARKEKKIERMRLKEEKIKLRKPMFSGFGLWLKRRRHEKEAKRRMKYIKKIMKKKLRQEHKAKRKEKRARKKIRKKQIKSLKREIRKKKIINLLAKLRLWKKQGYYGTAKLETELKRLKSQKD